MSHPILSISHFHAWAAQQPADEKYCYSDTGGCAIFQYLEQSGCPVRRVGGDRWADDNSTYHPFAQLIGIATVAYPHTYGALTERLHTAMSHKS